MGDKLQTLVERLIEAEYLSRTCSRHKMTKYLDRRDKAEVALCRHLTGREAWWDAAAFIHRKRRLLRAEKRSNQLKSAHNRQKPKKKRRRRP